MVPNAQRKMRAPLLARAVPVRPKNARSIRKNPSPQKISGPEKKMYCLLDSNRNAMRSPKEAWELVEKNHLLILSFMGTGILKRHGLPLTERRALLTDSVFLSALTWNPKKARFSTHCTNQIWQTEAIARMYTHTVRIPEPQVRDAKFAFWWLGKNPGGTAKQLAEDEGLSLQRAENILGSILSIHMSRVVDGVNPFNGIKEDDGGTFSGITRSSFICPNSLGFRAQEKRAAGAMLAKELPEIMEAVLHPREIRALKMWIWGGLKLEEVGERLGGVTKSRAQQICGRAIEKLQLHGSRLRIFHEALGL